MVDLPQIYLLKSRMNVVVAKKLLGDWEWSGH